MVDDAWSAKSQEALKQGDIGTLNEQLRALPPELLQQAIQTAHELGNRAFKAKAYYEAIDQYTSTITGDPERVAAWSNRAACYTATKQHDKALRDARTCVQLKPDWPKAHYRLGRALLGLGGERTSEAVAAFAKGCGLDPNNAEMQKWHMQAHAAWKKHVAETGGGAPKPRSFDSKAFDAMVKEHEAEEKVLTDKLEQEEAVNNMQFEKPDGSIMSKAEAEAMLTGQDPNAGPRGSEYKPSFKTSMLDDVGVPEAADAEGEGEGGAGAAEEFVAATTFDGAREGFVFSTGDRGTGYYRDDGARAAAGLAPEPEPQRKTARADSSAVRALRSYMQDVSELQVPNWQICALGDSELLSVFCGTIERLHAALPPSTRWLHMGAGTCVPLMKTISLCGVPAGPAAGAAAANADDMRELLESIGLPQLHPLFEEEEMTDSSVLVQMLPRPEQLRQALKEVGVRKVGQREKIVAALKDIPSPGASAASDVRVCACTGHSASYIFSAVHRVLTHNSVRKGVQLLHRRMEEVGVVEHPGAEQLGLGTPRRGSFLEEARRASLAERADVCVVDAEYFDEGLIGKRLLPILAHAKRELLSPDARVVPAAASLHAELLQVGCSEEAATGFDLSKLDRYRWAPCYEKFRVEEQPEGTVLRCSASAELLNFDLQRLSPEELLAGGKAEVTVTATQAAKVNGVLLWFKLDMEGDGQVVVSTEPPPSSGGNPGAGRHTWGQAIQWLVPAVDVVAGQTFTISTTFSPTRVKCDVAPVVPAGAVAVFSQDRPAHRGQCEEHDEVFLQCSAAAGLQLFETTPERPPVAGYGLDDLKEWSCATDEDGDEVLILKIESESVSKTVEMEMEEGAAKKVCKELTALRGGGAEASNGALELSGTLARWHFDLLADGARNRMYNDAIKRQLDKLIRRKKAEKTQAWYNQPDKKTQKKKKPSEAAALIAAEGGGKLVEVLDLGCGSGLLAMMAVRASKEYGEAGAVHVTGVDGSENLLNTAAEIVASNGHGAHMTLVHKDSRMMTVGETMGGVTPELKRKADLLVLENFDYGLLGEGLLPILHHACAVLLQPDAIVVPAIARLYGMAVEHRPAGREHTVQGFNVDLWRTYLYKPEYGGYNVGAEIAAGRMKALSEPFMAFEFDLNNAAKPASLSRAERLEALAQCEAAAHPEYDSEAPDPENIWGPLKSPMGQEALAEGDPAFKNGEMVLALQCYQKAVGMEPLNQPAQARLRAAKRALGFPGSETKNVQLQMTADGIVNSLVFWFELVMEKPSESDDDEDDGEGSEHSPAVISTAPVGDTIPGNGAHRAGTHWLQACQVLEEVRVAKGEELPVLAAIGEGGADVKFSIRRNDVAAPPYGERRTAVPPVDPLWVRAHQEAEQKMKKIEQLVVSSAEGHEQASEAAAAIAVDPGKGGAEAIDPQKANTFALSFHH